LQARRNLLLTLFVSQGVPMISGGDELGRTQGGNNNAYCQDSVLTWTDWGVDADEQAFLGFVDRVIALRRSQPALRRDAFLTPADARWLRPDAELMTESDWHDPEARALGLMLDGLLLVVNALDVEIPFTLPDPPAGADRWIRQLDTARPDASPAPVRGTDAVRIAARSAAVFTR
jgi:glycogen operon protein